MRQFARPSILVALAICILLPLVLPNNFMLDIAIRAALTAIAVVGLNLLMGFAGQVSIGHAAFVAIGSYGTGIITARLNWPPLVALAVAAAGAALVAYLVAKPILRLKGHMLTMATLGFGVIVNIALVNEVAWTGGPDGMSVVPLSIGTFELTSIMHWYVLAAALLVLSMVLSLNLYESPAGRAMRGLNSSEVAARAMGVDVATAKSRAFVASAIFATVSGSFSAHYLGFISPSISGFTHSVELATMVVVGGMASTFGAVLGAILLTVLPQLLGGLHGYESVFFGLILMLTMIFLPKGLVPSIALLVSRRRRS
ncbi:branched-chain amino acid ABC transporter permease [Rhodoferax sediminis]|jgi:branched-chain amino acid transport system permease protein|uniref:Branched-chain amino acid ABC transporter permease n=1 Tax=Rhodoferax sediminis TaxID=2509614 RepID=A0A515DCB8_9BURK|nr:branched-chain amino acid ABC transporter permease [Rhodoferax sediminis]QDL38058.1 branched-chain amino acid ABC transporter permease [Rhodoferax sediminis]